MGIVKSMKVCDDLIEELWNDEILFDSKLNMFKEIVLVVICGWGNVDNV